jgi:hypothetical protein
LTPPPELSMQQILNVRNIIQYDFRRYSQGSVTLTAFVARN